MRKLIVLGVLVGLLAGCGDPDYVEQGATVEAPPPQTNVLAERALAIAAGKVVPTPQDFLDLDVAPVINGISVPDGFINTGDVVVLLSR